MSKDNGGPAFPSPSGHAQSFGTEDTGLSVRDYFAGKAMALLANEDAISNIQQSARAEGVEYVEYAAAIFYNIADAMLAERAKAESDQ